MVGNIVMAKLHIICGNCGCNNMFKWYIAKDALDYAKEMNLPDEGWVVYNANADWL